jgi:hypothetical protein
MRPPNETPRQYVNCGNGDYWSNFHAPGYQNTASIWIDGTGIEYEHTGPFITIMETRHDKEPFLGQIKPNHPILGQTFQLNIFVSAQKPWHHQIRM